MTIAYSAGTSGTIETGTAKVSFTHPVGAVVGDVEVLAVVGSITSGAAWIVVTGGWTALVSTSTLALFARQVTASSADSTEIDYYNAGSNPSGAWVFGRYSGATQYTWSTATGLTAPSMTAATAGVVARLWLVTQTGTGTTTLPGSPLTTRQHMQAGTTGGAVYAGLGDASTGGGATGTSTATNSATSATGLAATFVFGTDRPPNTAAWSSPADGTALDRSVAQTLTYTATDPDSGDSQSQRKWRYSSDGGTTWTTTTETTISQSITIAGGTLAAGDYQFQVEIADQSGTWAASWSPSLHLRFADAPSAPTITEPTSGGTVAATNVLQWSFPGQVQYEARKVADDAGTADPSTIYYDSGAVVDANTRAVTMTNSTNGRWEHQQVRCMDSTGLWSTWADVRVQVAFNPPPTPTFTLTPVVDPFADPPKAAIVVGVATAAPGTGQVAATSVTVEARPVGATTDEWSRSGLSINGAVDFETPASGVEYEFRVTAVGDNGATADTGWVS